VLGLRENAPPLRTEANYSVKWSLSFKKLQKKASRLFFENFVFFKN
jgi:hypothetical protein